MLEFKDNLIEVHPGANFLVCGLGPSLDLFSWEDFSNFPGIVVGVDFIFMRFVPNYFLSYHWHEDNVIECGTGTRYMIRTKSTTQDHEWKDGFLEATCSTISKALSASFQMGAKRIFMIGVDCSIGPNGEKYFSRMPSCNISDKLEEKLLIPLAPQLDRFLGAYRKSGVEVYDLCPWGRITEADKIEHYDLILGER